MKARYIVQTVEGDYYVKRTSRFGPFYGVVYLTTDVNEARIWSFEGHARRAAKVVNYRFEENFSSEFARYGLRAFRFVKLEEVGLAERPQPAEP